MLKKGPSLKLQYELILAFCTIIIIPLIFVVFIHSKQISKTTEAQFVQFMQQVTDQMNKNIEKSIRDIDRMQFFYIYDTDLLKIIKRKKPSKEAYDKEYYDNNFKITNYMNTAMAINENIMSVFVHTAEGYEYGVPDFAPETNPFIEQKAKLEAHAHNAPRDLFMMLIGHYNYVSSVKDVITIGRACHDPYTHKYLGYIATNISYRIFEKLFENINSDNRMSVFVHNGSKILYHSEKNNVKEEDLKEVINLTFEKNSVFKSEITGSKYLLVSSYSDYAGLTVVEYVPMTLINQSAAKNSGDYWKVTLLIVALAIVLSANIAYRISKPVSKLEKAMAAFKKSKEFNTIINKANTRELWSLTESYNATVKAAKEWLEKEQQYLKNKRKLELLTLELQINPHFLYNTLGLISSKAYTNEQPEIVEVTKNLSELLRFNLKEKQMITLEEELEQVKRYIQIQKLGLSQEFIVVFDVDSRFNSQKILKATIQPLIENIIVHGFGKNHKYGLLKISAVEEDGDLIIAVTDNGTGMDEIQVKEINSQLRQPIDSYLLSEEKKHIGLKNVHYRIWQQFGEKYGLSIESIKNIGTTAYIRIPLEVEECEA
ncbi:MAG: histidine kinase [Clostridia bacterium]|nr:histidine kinase [Clostridia bacterium]